MSIVYQTNKKTGITYAYESTSFWVPELKQPRTKRKYLGKVDENGNIIPSSGRRRKKRPALTDVEKMELEDLKKIVTLQEQQLAQLESENEKLREIIRESVQSLSEVL